MFRDRLISPQVQLLLERMESHPEEFYKALTLSAGVFDGKWDFVLSSGEFTRIEKFLIKRKMKELKREATHRQILLTIMYGKEESADDYHVKMSTTGRFEQNQKMIISKAMEEEFQKAKNKYRTSS